MRIAMSRVRRHEFATSATRISAGSIEEHPVLDINRRRFEVFRQENGLTGEKFWDEVMVICAERSRIEDMS